MELSPDGSRQVLDCQRGAEAPGYLVEIGASAGGIEALSKLVCRSRSWLATSLFMTDELLAAAAGLFAERARLQGERTHAP
jgi:chemotaxis response regulator CheB